MYGAELESAACREEKETVRKELTSAKAQIDQLGEARAAHVDALRMEIAAADKRHDDKMAEVGQQISSLQQQLDTATSAKDDAFKQVESLQERVQSGQSSQASSQTRADDLEQQISSLQQQLSDEKSGRDSMLNQLETRQVQADNLQQQLHSTQSAQASSHAAAENAGQQLSEASAAHEQAIANQEARLKQDAVVARQEAATSHQAADGVRSVCCSCTFRCICNREEHFYLMDCCLGCSISNLITSDNTDVANPASWVHQMLVSKYRLITFNRSIDVLRLHVIHDRDAIAVQTIRHCLWLAEVC